MIYYELFYEYMPDMLGELYFRLNANLVPENRHPLDSGGIKRIYIFSTSGIGNLIMLTPMIQTLRQGIPDGVISVIVSPNGAKDVLEGSNFVDNIVTLDNKSVFKEIRQDFPDIAIAGTHGGFMKAKEVFPHRGVLANRL
jgi:hypothetical protein